MLEMEIRHFEPLDYYANEAFNMLCTNLFFTGGDIKKIMVTSCHSREGKSFTTMNLMRSLAGLGMRVALVDADIRASRLQETFNIRVNMPEGQRYAGLARYLAGVCGMSDVLAKTNIPNASMVLAGRNVLNSLPLLNSHRLTELLDALAEKFDIVLVDAPPVGMVIDAAKIATRCDGTLLIIQSGTVHRHELQRVLFQIEKTGCPILGTVLNQFDEQKYDDKYYYSKTYYSKHGEYGSRDKEKPRSPSDSRKKR